MAESFDDEYDEDTPPPWFWDNLSVYDYCVSWESCTCGFTVMVHWPEGKPSGVITQCLQCGGQNFTMAVLYCVN